MCIIYVQEYVKLNCLFDRVFEQVMKKKYYEHFRLLVYAAVFSEARVLTTTRLNQIESLLNTFVDEFPVLYGVCTLIILFLRYLPIFSPIM